MATTASDVLIETLQDWGVEVIFGIPGDGINGIIEALRKRQKEIQFIQVRHEESAAFMACAYAKYTGKLGVCLATSGPGGIHLLNGLYDAKLDGQPVVALTGLQFHDLVETHTQQDVELDKLYMDVAVYNARVMGPAHVENVAELACRTALSRRGVAHITMPVDVQSMPMRKKRASERNVPGHTSSLQAWSAQIPSEEDLILAADVLNKGKKVAILAGRGALGCRDELEELAEKLAAPVVKALLGKAVVPDTSSYTTGAVGLLGTKPSQEAMEECDTLLMVGTSFPYIEFLPEPGQARCVQIDIDPIRIGLRYPTEIGLIGDAKKSLQQLLPLINKKTDRSFLKKAQKGMEKWWMLMEERGSRKDKPMKPQVLAWELGKRLPDNAIVSSDSGTIATWWARQIKVKQGQMHSLSGTLATMANGLPYTIAAQVAYPDRPCFAFIGDGGFSMLMAEMATAVKYQLPIKVFIVKNNTLGQIKWEQMVFLGNPEYACELQPIDFAKAAEACGATGLTIEDPQECGEVIEKALQTKGPVVVQAIVDPYEPPMPAKITAHQTRQFAKSIVKGTPHRKQIVMTVTKDKIRELV